LFRSLVYLLRKRRRNEKEEEFFCSRVMSEGSGVPKFLWELFLKEMQDLNEGQKKQFASFFIEFQDVFSEEITAGNCRMVEYNIEIENSIPIKQTPRYIPFHLQREVDNY